MRLNEMRRGKGLVLLLAAVAATAVLTSLVTYIAYVHFFVNSVYDVREFYMQVYSDNVLGFNTDTDSMHFGIIPPGATGGRVLSLTAGGYKSLVTLDARGDISPWVHVSENNFVLEPYEARNVTVELTVPEDVVPLAFRNGTMRVTFREL